MRTRAGGALPLRAAAAAADRFAPNRPQERTRQEEYEMADMFEDDPVPNSKRTAQQEPEPPSASASINQEIKRCSGSLEELESFLGENRQLIGEFDYVNCATAVHLLGKLRTKDQGLVGALVNRSSTQSFRSRELSNFCYGMAAGSLASRMPDFVAEQAIASAKRFTSQALSLTLWSYAKMNHKDGKLLHALCREVYQTRRVSVALPPPVKRKQKPSQPWKELAEQEEEEEPGPVGVDVPSAQSLSNILWSLAVLQPTEHRENAKVCQVLCQDIVAGLGSEERKHEFVPQSLALIASSLATLRYRDDAVLELIQQRVVGQKSMRAYTPHAIGTLLVSFGRFAKQGGGEYSDLCAKMDVEVRYRVRDFIPAGLGNVCEGLANLDYLSEPLWERLLVETMRRKEVLSPHVLSQLLFAASKAAKVQPDLALGAGKRLLSAYATRELKLVAVGDLIMALDGLVGLRLHDSNFLAKLTKAVFAKRGEFKKQVSARELVALCVGLAKMDLLPDQPTLLDVLGMDACTRSLAEFPLVADQVDLLWAFACLDKPALFAQLLAKFEPTVASSTQCVDQLAEIALFADQHEIPYSLPRAPQQQRGTADDTAALALDEVTQALFQEFPDVQQHASVAGLRMDIFVPSKSLCIEIHSSESFFQTAQPTGGALFRHRLLRQQGYQVYSIPSQVFASLSPEARLAEVHKLMKQIK